MVLCKAILVATRLYCAGDVSYGLVRLTGKTLESGSNGLGFMFVS